MFKKEIEEIKQHYLLINYVREGTVYNCIYYENNVWICGRPLTRLLGIDVTSFKDIIEEVKLEQDNVDGVIDCCHYYFFDGNEQGYIDEEVRYYSIEMCYAISIALQTTKLLDYVAWARDIIVQNSNRDLSHEKKGFCYIRRYHHFNNDIVVPHHHDCYELIYYITGNGKTINNLGSYYYQPDTIVIVPPNITHEDYISEGGDCFCLTFYIDKPLQTAVFNPVEGNEKIIKLIYNQLVYAMELQTNAINNMEHEFENILSIILYNLQQLYANNAQHEELQIAGSDIIEHVKKYLATHYQHKIDMNILGEKVGYTKNHLNMLFKKSTGLTIYSYLLNIRLQKARELLANTNTKVSLIYKKCGFSSLVRFSQFFKEQTGVAPSVYRSLSKNRVQGGVLMGQD